MKLRQIVLYNVFLNETHTEVLFLDKGNSQIARRSVPHRAVHSITREFAGTPVVDRREFGEEADEATQRILSA